MRANAGAVGEFVDALLLDHGGIHVGDKQPLAALRDRLDHDVNGLICKRLPQPRAKAGKIVAVEENIGREIGREPVRRRYGEPGVAQRGADGRLRKRRALPRDKGRNRWNSL